MTHINAYRVDVEDALAQAGAALQKVRDAVNHLNEKVDQDRTGFDPNAPETQPALNPQGQENTSPAGPGVALTDDQQRQAQEERKQDTTNETRRNVEVESHSDISDERPQGDAKLKEDKDKLAAEKRESASTNNEKKSSDDKKARS